MPCASFIQKINWTYYIKLFEANCSNQRFGILIYIEGIWKELKL